MDNRNHRLNAPNNEALEKIEQLADRSSVSTLYFHERKEWEGKSLISDDEREARRLNDQREIITSLREEFWLLGLLVPTPMVLLVLIISAAATYLTPGSIKTMVPLAILAVFVWCVVTFLSIRKLYSIMYAHALKATPFLLVHLALLGIATQGSYLLTRAVHTDSLVLNTIIVAAGTYLASIILSAALVYIWTSQRLSSGMKLGSIALIGVAIVALILLTF